MPKPTVIVDPHIHLWELATGWYPLQEKGPESGEDTHGVGDFSKIMGRDYTLDDYLDHANGYDVRKIVHVTAAQAPSSWPDETRMLQELYDQRGFPHGIVGWTDFERPVEEVDAELDRHAAFANFRGIRHQTPPAYNSPHVDACFQVMQRRGLIYDTVAHQDTLPAAAQTVERFGEMSFVLEHAGWPTAADAETFTIWKAGIEAVAKAPNAAAKISGLMMPLGRFDLDTLRPWVLATIEAFGADRCMFASNFPVDWLWVEYGDLMDGYAEIVADFSEDERAAMFAGNAERWYRI
ncbi:MAG: hypothetical protein QOI92_925 [Chloroflexota bacterium]|nr:hypothetical protein [Chloroflexota bacterium]